MNMSLYYRFKEMAKLWNNAHSISMRSGSRSAYVDAQQLCLLNDTHNKSNGNAAVADAFAVDDADAVADAGVPISTSSSAGGFQLLCHHQQQQQQQQQKLHSYEHKSLQRQQQQHKFKIGTVADLDELCQLAVTPKPIKYGELNYDYFDKFKLFVTSSVKSVCPPSEGGISSGGGGGGVTSGRELSLNEVLAKKIPEMQENVRLFRAEYGLTKVADITVSQLYGGMRGLMALIWEPSVLDPDEGIRFRGLTVDETLHRLPKPDTGSQPLAEGMFWLLLTGEVPTKGQVELLSRQLADRAILPQFIEDLLNALPQTMHPMTQLSIAVTALSHESKFRAVYKAGVPKQTLWEYAFDDSMDLLAKLPVLAGIIYNKTCLGGKLKKCKWDNESDWSHNFACLLGYAGEDEFNEMLRLYLILHCDHEGGNVSAHTTHLVGSALSDPYLSYAAGINGLAGPLHGLASQEVLVWLLDIQNQLGHEPTDKQLQEFINKTLNDGKVIPGYGHAVLRITDPRYTALRDFALKYLPNNDLFKLVTKLQNIVPPTLKKWGKVKNPNPNVDCHSGILLNHYGMTDTTFYTVIFAVSRAMGVLAQYVLSRALGLPIERPKSISTDNLSSLLKELDKHKKVLRV